MSVPRNSSAIGIGFGPATYIKGTDTTTFTLSCGGLSVLPIGGTLTFVVYAFGDIVDDLYLHCDSLPQGATFPSVSGIQHVQSTFNWTISGPFTGSIGFYILNYGPPWCYLNFDMVLPVELSSFNSIVYGNDVTLKWQTSSETNNSGFEIERALTVNGNNSDWHLTGIMPGKGTTSSLSDYEFNDKNLNSGIYKYRLKQIDYNGNFEYFYLNENVQIGIPSKFELSQNYPNPFNPSTNLEFGISELGFVSLKVYDASGKEVVTLINEIKPAGYYSVKFNGAELSSGIYFYILSSTGGSGNFISTKRMILLK
ncbi:MAG: T9SS type A sorting domain-containing protein [Ignavibacteria bacterium]